MSLLQLDFSGYIQTVEALPRPDYSGKSELSLS